MKVGRLRQSWLLKKRFGIQADPPCLDESASFGSRAAIGLTRFPRALTPALSRQGMRRIGEWRLELDNGCVRGSRELRSLLGVPSHRALRYSDYLARVPKADRSRVKRAWEAYLNEGLPYSIEHRLMIDNEPRWVRVCVHAREEGRRSSVVGSLLDITDSRRARTELERQLALQACLLEFSRHSLKPSEASLEAAVQWVLRCLGLLMGADRGYVYRVHEEASVFQQRHCWSLLEGITDGVVFEECTHERMPWFLERLARSGSLLVPDVAKLPSNRATECEYLLSRGCAALLCVPLWRQEELTGFIGFDIARAEQAQWTREDRQALEMLGHILGLAYERTHYEAQLMRYQRRLRALSAHHERLREAEYARIAREVHDELGQYLTALRMDAALLQFRYAHQHPDIAQGAEAMKKTADAMLDVVRNIATALRPHTLNMGLVAAAEWQLSRFAERSGIRCHFEAPEEVSGLSDEQVTALFRILQEALTNIARHAQSREIRVWIQASSEGTLLEVLDDGIGFDAQARRIRNSFGLLGMRERASMCGGEFRLQSVPGQGTRISVWIPAQREEAHGKDYCC